MNNRYPIKSWRPFFDIAVSWGAIAFAWWLTLDVTIWLYPVSFILVANRILALSLICHEGLHRVLHPNNKMNEFLGRYLCAFPTFISYTKYRKLHLLHHASVGSDRWDPDRHLYQDFPMPIGKFVRNLFFRVITLRTAYDFILYYTEYPEAFRRKRNANGSIYILSPRSDFIQFVIFHTALLFIIIYFNIIPEFLALYTAPLLLLTQPYVMLMGALQHGPISERVGGYSRTIAGSKLYMWLLLPVDINYHAEHHREPLIPHYWLKQRAIDVKRDGHVLWTESYAESLRALF